MLLRGAFHALGTEIELLLDAEHAPESSLALDAAEVEFERLEHVLSRFRPDSELPELNDTGSLDAGLDLFTVAQLTLDARERTGGRFDPTVHAALVAAGYDRTPDEVAAEGADDFAGCRCGGSVAIDPLTRRIELEPDVLLDLGGIAKGYAVDCAALLLGVAGPCLANAGGDLAVQGGSWPVGVETPDGTLTPELDGGAIATSGRDRRRWSRNGEERHYLIDPATGRPADTELLTVTVVAGSAVEAEVYAKSLFLAGRADALEEADALGLRCVLVTVDGETLLGGGLA
jgi:thiamine biosynthesis lipoprotein